MSNDAIQEQIVYYRARGGEYDEWLYRIGRYDHAQKNNRRWFDATVMTTQRYFIYALGTKS